MSSVDTTGADGSNDVKGAEVGQDASVGGSPVATPVVETPQGVDAPPTEAGQETGQEAEPVVGVVETAAGEKPMIDGRPMTDEELAARNPEADNTPVAPDQAPETPATPSIDALIEQYNAPAVPTGVEGTSSPDPAPDAAPVEPEVERTRYVMELDSVVGMLRRNGQKYINELGDLVKLSKSLGIDYEDNFMERTVTLTVPDGAVVPVWLGDILKALAGDGEPV